MRIVQLSDIHLSKTNIDELQNFFMDALLRDLKQFHEIQPIDVILLTGDLVDKGGDSLGANGYEIFTEKFINPLLSELGLSKDKILFIPGNHDINREFIDEENEFYLAQKLTKDLANDKIKEIRDLFNNTNKRIQKFKNFEKQFHSGKKNYLYSNNESLSIEIHNDQKVGFALINDSWRCSSALNKEQHFIGFNQLFNAKSFFKKEQTKLNIAVFHHPLDSLNAGESEEIEIILKSHDFDIAIFGHSHKHKFEFLVSSNGGYIALNGRSAFNSPTETDSQYQSGYNILDLEINEKTYTLYARKFIKSGGHRFDKDVDSLPDGVHHGTIEKKDAYYQLNKNSNVVDDSLPSGYSADVDRIVKLLIGKSLYPNPYIFVRELIQNAVDACNRIKERHTHLIPKIAVNINTEENYFEVSDEGDGMSKRILKEHFSIIGKSISQEFNDSNGNFNLISQFGIGFISTFIVAQKVYISTRSESDELINFEIVDVFRGFNYILAEPLSNRKISGTTIRVYLKKEYNSLLLFGIARNYCRHIDNLEFNVNSTIQRIDQNWNIENGTFPWNQKNNKYEIKLVISNNPRHLLISNSGFLINHYSPFLIPYKFPFIIGGEVNFTPKSIDFDISRSNIIETSKSADFKKDLSVSLRPLFRRVLDLDNTPLKSSVIDHICFYLAHFDAGHGQFSQTYVDFYSKKELIDLCLEYLIFDFEYGSKKLLDIIHKLKGKSFNKIYVSQQNPTNDYENIVVKYLHDKGNLVITPKVTTIQFRDGQQAINNVQVIQIIAQQYGFSLINVNSVDPLEIKDMRMNKQELPHKLVEQLFVIENENQIKVSIAQFNRSSKPVIKFQNEYFINYEHLAFQNLIADNEILSSETIKTYFLGLMGIGIKSDV